MESARVRKHSYFRRNTLRYTKIFCLNVIFKWQDSIGMNCVLVLLFSRTQVHFLTGLIYLWWVGHVKVN
jgi:hypothetical protein